MNYRQFVVLFFLLTSAWAYAAKPADPARFEKDILAFAAADAAQAPPKDAVVFVGASNIRRWQSLPERFKNLPVLNRGFGGSQLSDVVHYAERCVIKYQPKQIYLNAGGNDLHAGRTPEEVLASFEAFVTKVKTALPKTAIAFISIPPSASRWSEVEQVKQANALIAASCAKQRLDFIEVFSLLLGADGTPYAGGCFVFDILLPAAFPAAPPRVKFLTTGGGRWRANPNLYADGTVCLSLIGTWDGPGWEPARSTLLQLLVSLQGLVLNREVCARFFVRS